MPLFPPCPLRPAWTVPPPILPSFPVSPPTPLHGHRPSPIAGVCRIESSYIDHLASTAIWMCVCVISSSFISFTMSPSPPLAPSNTSMSYTPPPSGRVIRLTQRVSVNRETLLTLCSPHGLATVNQS